MDGQEILAYAANRSVVLGEHHSDRKGLRAILQLMDTAHDAGYRKLGIETSNFGCRWNDKNLPGLFEELEYLRSVRGSLLPEYDAWSSLDTDHTGQRPRMNRHWQMQKALLLGWEVIAIDPHHWNWRMETVNGYFSSRELTMADMIRRNGQMIAVVGSAHLQGLAEYLGDSIVWANTSELYREFDARLAFAARLPFLAPD